LAAEISPHDNACPIQESSYLCVFPLELREDKNHDHVGFFACQPYSSITLTFVQR